MKLPIFKEANTHLISTPSPNPLHLAASGIIPVARTSTGGYLMKLRFTPEELDDINEHNGVFILHFANHKIESIQAGINPYFDAEYNTSRPTPPPPPELL